MNKQNEAIIRYLELGWCVAGARANGMVYLTIPEMFEGVGGMEETGRCELLAVYPITGDLSWITHPDAIHETLTEIRGEI